MVRFPVHAGKAEDEVGGINERVRVGMDSGPLLSVDPLSPIVGHAVN